MSLAETQQIMQVLQEIMALLNGAEIKTAKLNAELPRIKESLANMRQLERVALRYLALSRQIGLPSDVDQAISKVMQLIVMFRMLQISMNMMAGGPIGILMGVAGGLLTAATLANGNFLEGY